MKKTGLLTILCLAVLTQCELWNKPLVAPLKEKVDELTSIKSIFISKYPKKNAFQTGVDVDKVPQSAEDWAGPDYELELSGMNGMDEARVLVPGLEYHVEEAGYDAGGETGETVIRKVTLVLNDTHRYGRLTAEFDIRILPPGVRIYTIVPYHDGKGNSVLAVPSSFTGNDASAGLTVDVFLYPKNGWRLDVGSVPSYGFTQPGGGNDYTEIDEAPYRFTANEDLITRLGAGNEIHLYAEFIKPVLELSDSNGDFKKFYSEGDEAGQLSLLAAAVGDAKTGDTITVMSDIELNGVITVEEKSLTIRPYGEAGSRDVTIKRGDSSYTGSLFTVKEGSVLTLKGKGTRRLVVDGAMSAGTGAAALVSVTGGSLAIGDGAILQNNKTNGTGGGVYLADGLFTMSGGVISGNMAEGENGFGGGVYLADGLFTMSGGEISGNKAKPFGGGLHLGGGKAEIYGGKIRGNSAEYASGVLSWGGGGGVHVRGGSLIVGSSAAIEGNSVPNGGGGGVAVSGSGYFEMNGGEISGNSTNHSWISGGGVILFDGDSADSPVFRLGGGLIRENESESASTSASLPGAGVFFHTGTFSMEGGALIAQGNDIFLGEDKYIDISGPLSGTEAAQSTLSPDAYSAGRKVLDGDSAYVSAAGGRFVLDKPGWSIVAGTLSAAVTGGTVSFGTVGNDVYETHTFTASGTFSSGIEINGASLLLVGGGGGGGGAGGGGAGGFLVVENKTLSAGAYPVQVGNGGAGSLTAGINGGDSTFDGYTAYGGGGGGAYVNGDERNGLGGSGATGGNSKSGSGGGGGGGTGSTNGGAGIFATNYGGGGGGGAGGAGGDAKAGAGGAGGSGTVSAIRGGTYAVGGTGSVQGAQAAPANTGNGGDGGYSASGAAGGSGIIVLRFPVSQP
ncbi:MAG: hypothetical protein LBO04_01565 [Spirochaetaceae bacterium]|jgi:hypothetical protein|nr:hypothetical protein [Spirochaetaceae bacterium]